VSDIETIVRTALAWHTGPGVQSRSSE